MTSIIVSPYCFENNEKFYKTFSAFGCIARMYQKLKIHEDEKDYNEICIIYDKWFNTPEIISLVDNLALGLPVKIVYDDSLYWLVVKNNEDEIWKDHKRVFR
jgi:hypothetical protein